MTTPRKTKLHAEARDAVIGRRLRERRQAMDMSQAELGAAVGMSFQQIQKYEHGTNRIAAVTLLDFSRILGVPVHWFYDGFKQPMVKLRRPADLVLRPGLGIVTFNADTINLKTANKLRGWLDQAIAFKGAA